LRVVKVIGFLFKGLTLLYVHGGTMNNRLTIMSELGTLGVLRVTTVIAEYYSARIAFFYVV
jgi:hypothetical protein